MPRVSRCFINCNLFSKVMNISVLLSNGGNYDMCPGIDGSFFGSDLSARTDKCTSPYLGAGSKFRNALA